MQGNVRFIMHSFGMMRVLTGSLYFRNFYTGKEFRGTRSGKEETDFGISSLKKKSLLTVLFGVSECCYKCVTGH